jgi:hypothetical protein
MVEQSMWEFGRASDAEALEMTVTFIQITDPARRAAVLRFAKKQLAACTVPRAAAPQLVNQDNARPRSEKGPC